MTNQLDKQRLNAWAVNFSGLSVMEGLNCRIEEDYDVQELKDQIVAAGGITEPFEVIHLRGEYFVSKGHRRYRAATELIAEGHGKLVERVQVVMAPKGTKIVDLLVNQVHSNSGKRFSQWSNANLVMAMSEEGLDRKAIVQRTGWKANTVSELFKLADVDPGARQFAIDHKIATIAVLRAASSATEERPVLDILQQAKALADSQQRSVSRDHVKSVVNLVAPVEEVETETEVEEVEEVEAAPVSKVTQLHDSRSREELMAICSDFEDWHLISKDRLASFVRTIERVQSQAATASAVTGNSSLNVSDFVAG